MMRGVFLILAVFLLPWGIGCDREAGQEAAPGNITLVGTHPSGCNNLHAGDMKSALPEGRDTVTFSLRKDTLVMFTGINYICCAPFRTSATTQNDSLVVTLEDRCNYPQENCYCKCMCYYTWELLFTGFRQGTLRGFRVILDDPRQKEPAVVLKGGIHLR